MYKLNATGLLQPETLSSGSLHYLGKQKETMLDGTFQFPLVQ